uniref:Vam6/Vps39-like protein n=1 Tax=Aceria tosichella TaxID=561515 RepID=A0A6G1S3W6_9ACAR
MQIFKPIALVKNLPINIECLTAHNDCIVVTTKQGHLMKYRIKSKRNATISANRDLDIELELTDSCKQFSKKPVAQIETVPELKIIITLSDGLIHINDYDNLEIVHQIIQKTKGATCFATNLQTQMTLTGEAQHMLRMCVVVKRKLILLYWKNKNFHEMSKEFNLNDQPRMIAWCSESLFIGYKSEYDLIKLTSGTTEGEIKNLSATGGRQPEPIVRILHDDKVSINRDENTYILDQNGDPYLKYSITWSDIPLNIAENYPYLIALLPSSIIEVRTIEPHLFIQRLEFAQLTSNLSKIKILTSCAGRSKSLMIAASTNDIFALVPIPLDQQKAEMVAEKHFELALRLANMQKKDSHDASTREIELQYAHDLFHKGSYQKALELFFNLEISPLIVIDLFPDLSDKAFTQESSNSTSAQQLTTIASDKNGHKSNGSIDGDSDERISALKDYLIQIRRKIYSSSRQPQANAVSTLESDDGLSLFSHMKSPRAIEKLKQEVDTTLLKCYLKTTDALVASLLRLPDNHCKLQVTEKALEKYKKYNELIILYQSRGLHRRALELLKNHFQNSPISGYEKTVQYLQHLGQDQLEIICEYAQWVLQNDPELGLKIFTADLPEAEQLDRNLVLEFLHHNAPQMEIPYLEHIIHFWNDIDSGFHTTLCLRYRQKVAPLLAKYLESIGNQVPCPAGQEPGELGELRRKLLDFLEISDYYSIKNLPDLLQNEGLCEERAIVLGKIGQHKEALDIFVYVLNNTKRAEEYCLSVYNKKLPNSQDIFLLLLKTYVHGPNNFSSDQLKRKLSISSASQLANDRSENNMNFSSKIIRLLAEHGDKMDPLKTIAELPGEFNLVSIGDYLDKTVKRKLQEGHEREMFRQLVMAKFYQVQKSWIDLQRATKIVIGDNTNCQVCNKKIGNSAFVRFPNLDLVHYSCKDRYGKLRYQNYDTIHQ